MGSDSSAETIPENCIKSIITLSIAFRVFWGKLKLTQSYSSVQKRTAVIKEKALLPWNICLAKMPALRYAFLEEIFMELRTSRYPINNIVVLQGGFLS